MGLVMRSLSDLRVGDEIPPLTKGPITRQLLVEWCAAENDYYPLHYDERVAAAMKLPGTPIQGTYKVALMGQAIQRWLAGRGVLNSLSARYRGLNLEGEQLTAHGRITRIDTVSGCATLEMHISGDSGESTTDAVAVVTLQRQSI